jgi:hypothetical protein
MAAASGQAFFIEKGTPHGFRNVGDTPAAVLEIFVKDGTSAAKIQAVSVTPGALRQTVNGSSGYTRRVHSAGTLA